MFKGFTFSTPEFPVVVPQTGLSFTVRSMNTGEVGKLKSSLVSPNVAHKFINKAIFDCLSDKPDFIDTYDDFKKFVTTRDREALLFALYISTFGEERDFNPTCSECGKENELKVSLNDMYQINMYPFSVTLTESYKLARAAQMTDHDPEIEAKIKEREDEEAKQKAAEEAAARMKKIEERRKKMLSEAQKNNPEVPDTPPDGITLVSKENVKKQEEAKKAAAEAEQERIAAIKIDPKDLLVPKPDKDSIMLDSQKEAIKKSQEYKDAMEAVNPDSILYLIEKVYLPVSKVTCFLKQPTLWEEEEVLSKAPLMGKDAQDVVSETLIINKFTQEEQDVILTDRADIVAGYQSLPPRDKMMIFEEFNKKFSEYEMKLDTKYFCKSCSSENVLRADITMLLFRSLSQY